MAGQRFEIAARLVRGAIVPVSLATLVALPMVAAQTAGGGGNGAPAAGTPAAGQPGRGPGGGGFRRNGRGRRGGRNGGANFGRRPGGGPAVTVQGTEPLGPIVAAPTTFRIATPADGATVRGLVTIQVPAGRMENGSYVSFAINDPLSSTLGEGLQYATVRNDNSGTFQWTWDTRAVGADGNPVFPDKNYTIYVIAHDPLGREMANGEAQITVTLNNFLPRTTGPVRLSYRLAVGDQANYVAKYSLAPHLAGDEDSAPKVNGSAQWDVSVDDVDRTAGIAALSVLFNDVSAEDVPVVRNGRLTATWNATLFESLFGQRTASFDLTPDGELTPVGRPGPYDWARVGLAGNIYIPLRDTPVTVGDRWDGPMTIWTLGNHSHRTRVGQTTNTLVAFEWMNGVKTAKIRTDYQVELPPPGQQSGASTGGPQLGGMASSFTPGGAGAGAGGGNAPVTARGTLRGQRYTWFDFRDGRVVRVIDKRTIANLPALFNQAGGGAAGGGGMMGMGGGAGGGNSLADLSWLPGFQYSAAAAQAAASAPGGFAGVPAGLGGGGMPGGYPGMGGGGMPGGYPGMGGGGMPGGYPGMGGGGMPGGYPGMGGGGMPGGYPGMGGGGMPGGYPGMGGGGMPGGYPGMGGGFGSAPSAGAFGPSANSPFGGQGGVSPFQVQQAPEFDETIETSLVSGG